MWPPTLTPCECKEPGWCERHQCQKTPEWHFACRRVQSQFERWEQGEGPCVNRLGERPVPQPPAPCVHRSSEPVGEVECELCGQRKILVPVYECIKFGRCTERRYGNRSTDARSTQACLSCSEYVANEIGPKSS